MSGGQTTPTNQPGNIHIGVMKMLSSRFAIRQAVRDIGPAASVRINDAVYRLKRRDEDVITLSLGEAFFDQPMAAISKDEFTAGMHYSDSRGIPALRQKIAAHYAEAFSATIDPEKEILISAGSKPILFMAMLAAVEAGKEVLIHEPGWLSYPEQATLAGAVPRHIPYDADIDGIIASISANTGMLIINNPNNPAGRLYTGGEIETLYNACHARGVYLLLDESYSDFAPPGTFASLANIAPKFDGALVINSLSKNLGVSGWRIGYLMGAREFIDNLLKLNQHLLTCAPTLLANYCATHFDDMIAVTKPQIAALQAKRDRVANTIAERNLRVLNGSTTFYFFLSINDFPGTDVEFAQKLIVDDKVAVVPGSAYGMSTDRFVRISIGTESEDRINSALDAIRRQIGTNNFDRDSYTQALEDLIGESLI